MGTALAMRGARYSSDADRPATLFMSAPASTKVFGITELVEAILLEATAEEYPPAIDVKFLFSATRVSKTSNKTIKESQELRMRMFLQPRASSELVRIVPDRQEDMCDSCDEFFDSIRGFHYLDVQGHHDTTGYNKYRIVDKLHKPVFDTQANPLLLPGSQQLPMLRIFTVTWGTNHYEDDGIIIQLSASKEALEACAKDPWVPYGASWEDTYLSDKAVNVQMQVKCDHGHPDDYDRDPLRIFWCWEDGEKLGNMVKPIKFEVGDARLDVFVRDRARECAAMGFPVKCQCELCLWPGER
ncbi:hypothetical protein LTR95_011572 [Oleoguttula sp. CCFEE 5521]